MGYKKDGQPFDIHVEHVIDDMRYPVGWFFIQANREALGIDDDGMPTTTPGPDLSALKAAKNEQINAWRAAANQSTFPHEGKDIACDPLSRSDIDAVASGIALSGGFPTGFPMAWKATDNTFITLPDVDAFKAMYASMTARGTQNFQHSQALKALLAAADTQDEIESIAW